MESAFHILFSLCRDTRKHSDWVVACLEGAWPKIVGESLSGICRPASFRNTELCIEILDPSWEQALADVRGDLENKLRDSTGGVVRFVRLRRHATVKAATPRGGADRD